MAYILAGTLQARFLNQTTGAVILTTKTLQENTFAISVSAADIRGGLSNTLLGKYFYDSIMDATITDALFSLEHVALNVGGQITIGGEAVTDEQITVAVENQITVTNTPVNWNGVGTIGWYTLSGQDNWQVITFTGKTANVAGLPVGSVVCVRYIAQNDALKEFTVPSSIIPNEVVLEVEGALFKANEKSFVTSSQVGKLVVTVPRFLLNGSVDLAMSSSGASTTNISGSALASFDTGGCETLGKYAKVQQIISNQAWDENLLAMAVDNASLSVAVAGAATLKLIGIYKGGATGVINNTNLTFTSSDVTKATVSNAGVVTGVAAGDVVITIADTTKPAIDCFAQVTVTA